MGQRKQVLLVEDPPEATVVEAPDDAPSEVDAVLAELASQDDYLILFRLRPDGSKWDRIKRFVVSEFAVDKVAECYGGGDYKVVIYDGKTHRYKKHIQFSFDPRIKGSVEQPLAGAPLASLPQAETQTVAMLRDELKAMTGQMQTAMTMLLQQAISQKGFDESKFLEKAAQWKQLFGGQSAFDPRLAMEMFKTGVEMARQASDGGGGLDGIGEKLLGIIGERVITQWDKLNSKPMLPDGRQPVKPVQPVQPAQLEQPTEPNMGSVDSLLAAYVPGFIQQAKRGGTPGVYANVLLDNCPPYFYPKALDVLRAPDILDRLTAKYPAVAEVKEWFEELRQELIALLEEEVAAAPASGADGHATAS